jgi:hypothetical protein
MTQVNLHTAKKQTNAWPDGNHLYVLVATQEGSLPANGPGEGSPFVMMVAPTEGFSHLGV